MATDAEIQALEDRLRTLDETIARMRADLIWKKRDLADREPPPDVVELEARYLALSEEFTATWRVWNQSSG